MPIPREEFVRLRALWEQVRKQSGGQKEFLMLAKSLDPDFAERLSPYPTLGQLAELITLESHIDFEKANEERANVIEELMKYVEKEDLEMMVLRSLNFKLGKTDQGEFHRFLVQMMDDYQLDENEYENVVRYAEYTERSERLDLAAAATELMQFGEQLMADVSNHKFA